ncbi:MAG: PAS domain S-box protein [Bacteroidales bacterium]|nr:PAS domain S-box protein [Bacteroidales bacterium]
MTNLEEDIVEYGKTLEKLQKENLALKKTLRRYAFFAEPSAFDSLESDLYEQLQYTEKFLDVFFRNIQIPAFAGSIIYADEDNQKPLDFVFTRINPEFAKFYSKKVEDIIGKTNSELSLMKSSAWLEGFAQAVKILDTVSFNAEEDGEILSVKVSAVRHDTFFADFKPDTGDSQAGKKIRENLKFTQKMIDAIPVPLFYKDVEGRYLLCNDCYAKTVIGVSPETIIGKTSQELDKYFPKEYADFYQGKDIELIKEKGIQVYEGPIKCADNIVREYIVSKTLITDSSGKISGIIGVMQDIDKMIKARRELAESENRYKTLFNGIKQPVIVVDLDGNIIMCNSTAVELFEEDTTNGALGTTKIPAEEFIDMDLIKSVAQTGEVMTRKLSVVVAGKERWYLSTMQLINDFMGERVVQIISNDISELKRYQAELLKQKNHAEDSNNLKTIFLANIAHETRTPANIISGFVQMIQSGLHPEKLNDYLTAIFKNTKKLLDIIDDIVELSKIESGQIKLRHEICSVNSILEEAFIYLTDTHAESGKKLELLRSEAFNEYDALIYADNQYISQIFKKLIANAVTFTQNGKIEIGAKIGQETVTFYVKDTGIGISESKLNIIFERFRQADEGISRQYGGNGLGLAIANELVKRMDGKLSVQSVLNEGSTFSFYIPYRKAGM